MFTVYYKYYVNPRNEQVETSILYILSACLPAKDTTYLYNHVHRFHCVKCKDISTISYGVCYHRWAERIAILLFFVKVTRANGILVNMRAF